MNQFKEIKKGISIAESIPATTLEQIDTLVKEARRLNSIGAIVRLDPRKANEINR
jgi:hypothetical protein